VTSVNARETWEALQFLRPEVVVVNGTRIITNETLLAWPVPFINIHAGITPQYRGVHGGYWALVEGRPDLVGTTVHLIDHGIDTGAILGQARFPVTEHDSFATYPYLHVAVGLPLVASAVADVLGGAKPEPQPPLDSSAPSVLRYHPTVWGYLIHRLADSVR
jgi:methionyl-tRNA formyltransferase